MSWHPKSKELCSYDWFKQRQSNGQYFHFFDLKRQSVQLDEDTQRDERRNIYEY